MKKLLLINPVSEFRRGFLRSESAKFPPLVYGILAALTPDNWEIEILDENFDEFTFQEADLVGLTAYTSSIYRAYEIAAVYRKKNIPVVIGGVHVSMMPKEAIQYADSVVVGEAESVWKNVIADFENGKLQQFYYGTRLSLDQIPKAKHELFHKDYFIGSIMTTRGCPFDCSFCTVTAFNGSKYRMRPVENVLDELETIPQENFFFIDDNIIGYSKQSRDHAKAIFQGMIDRGIKKKWWSQASLNFADDPDLLKLAFESGCRMIFIGIESEKTEGLESTNKKLNLKIGVDKYETAFKRIHDAGIAILGSFIFGLETDTTRDLINRKDYIINSSIDCYQAAILTPMPGTQTFKQLSKENRISRNNYPFDWQYYSGEDIAFTPSKMSEKELLDIMKLNRYELYGKKTMIKKFIKTLRATRSTDAAVWAISSSISYRNMLMDIYGDERFTIESLIGSLNMKLPEK
ncbi:MAG: radical SAM protein [Bacteroidetes bacterium]|nr:MAG: radical SAM protein [Bacteroidota bacterium]